MKELLMLDAAEKAAISKSLAGLEKASNSLRDSLLASARRHDAVDDAGRFDMWKAAVYAAFKGEDTRIRARLRQAVRRLAIELFPPEKGGTKERKRPSLSSAYDAFLAAIAAMQPSEEKKRASASLDALASILKIKD